MLFMIHVYLSAIETLICGRYDTRFSKYGIELIVALSSTNATKITTTL